MKKFEGCLILCFDDCPSRFPTLSKMRTYSFFRYGKHIRYTEVNTANHHTVYFIPDKVPRLYDPVMLWKSTPNMDKKDISSIKIQNIHGVTWFEMKSTDIPLDKMISYSEPVIKYMT